MMPTPVERVSASWPDPIPIDRVLWVAGDYDRRPVRDEQPAIDEER
ncbi:MULTISPECIES: hypothetical protein [unclassified Methylobacterium]|jgi:hypothetical protein|nr:MULTISPECIES: hypothetical protein [unclassified Methylobacterium]